MYRIPVLVVLLACLLVLATGVVLAVNEGPLADAGLDQKAEVGETVLLDATGSREPDGEIAAYEWRIETPRGNIVTPADPTDPRTRYVVHEPGRYEVTITVKDGHGSSASDTLFVYVTGGEEGGSDSVMPDSASSPTEERIETETITKPEIGSLPSRYREMFKDINSGDGFSGPPEINGSIQTTPPTPGIPGKADADVTITFDGYTETGSTIPQNNNHWTDSIGMGKSGMLGPMPDPKGKTGAIEGFLYGREGYTVGKSTMGGERASNHVGISKGGFFTHKYSKGASTAKTVGYNEVRMEGPDPYKLQNYDSVDVTTEVAEGAGVLDTVGISDYVSRSDYENSRTFVQDGAEATAYNTRVAINTTAETVSSKASEAAGFVSSVSVYLADTFDGGNDDRKSNSHEWNSGSSPWSGL